jgi:microcystin-dependent protein
MVTVTGFTSDRMLEIENSTVVDGDVVGNNLILKTRDNTTIDAGNVRGPTGPQGPTGGFLTGEVRMTVIPVAALPANWFFLDGTIIVNAETLYPAFWAIAPVAWRSGSNINLPDTSTRYIVSGDPDVPSGALGGSDVITLAAANIPSHTHGPGSLAAASAGAHTHDPSDPSYSFAIHKAGVNNAPSADPAASTTTGLTYTSVTNSTGAHTHDVSGATSAAGSGTPYTHRPKNFTVNMMIYAGPHS